MSKAIKPRPPTTTSSTDREISTARTSAEFSRSRGLRLVAGELIRGARCGAGRRAGVAAWAGWTDGGFLHSLNTDARKTADHAHAVGGIELGGTAGTPPDRRETSPAPSRPSGRPCSPDERQRPVAVPLDD